MPYYRKRKQYIPRRRKSGRRRKLQSMNKMTRRAVNLVTGALPVVRAANNLYQFARSARKPGTRPPKKNIQKDDQNGGYNQWSQQYSQKTFGKLTAKKIDKMFLTKTVFAHVRIGPFNDNGQVYLANYLSAAGERTYPLILYELNSINNIVNGTTLYAPPVWNLQQLANGNMTWFAHGGLLSDGTTTNVAWVVEKSSHTLGSSSSYPLSQSIHQWTSLDLELWGAAQKPTKFNICLCQFSEDVLPPESLNGVVNNYTTITDPNANQFWQALVKHYSYSPLAKMEDGFNKKKMKILKSYTINIDPTANYENDPDPHVKTLKLFYRFNRKCNFQWKYANTNAMSITDMNQPDWIQVDGENQTRVHPNARLFVMVRASNYTPVVSPASVTNATSPSISWRMRSCHLLSQ